MLPTASTPPASSATVELVVNGRVRTLDVPAAERLATTLRERLHLTGTHVACARGECGACTVLVDGEPVYACLVLTVAAPGSHVTTIEGVGTAGEPHPVQRAFVAHDAVQCGYCTPGQVMAAIALLERDADPDDEAIRRAMSGNLCRCGTYPKIAAAIRAAATAIRESHGR